MGQQVVKRDIQTNHQQMGLFGHYSYDAHTMRMQTPYNSCKCKAELYPKTFSNMASQHTTLRNIVAEGHRFNPDTPERVGKHAQHHMVIEAMGALTSNDYTFKKYLQLIALICRNDGRNDCSKQR